MTRDDETRAAVQRRYAQAALQVLDPARQGRSSCCGGACCADAACSGDPISTDLYRPAEVANLPDEATAASLGCGNPTALAELRPAEIVLDLGSGGGLDVLLAAQRVGPAGKVYGLDMTDEMLTLARRNAARAGATNAAFLKGQIEAVPLADASVDVVISNCVINLSTDKARVLREAYRVLKPGGRLAVSDIVVEGPVPSDLRQRVEVWAGCVAGALDRHDYLALLEAVGFADASVEPTRYYDLDALGDPEASAWLATQPAAERSRLQHAFMSAFVRARKPTS